MKLSKTEPNEPLPNEEGVRATGSRNQRWAVIGMLVLTFLLVSAAIGHVWVRLRIVRMGYELSREATRAGRLERLHQKLSVEHSLLRSPQRIEELARRKLQLRSPKPGEVQLIRQGSGLFGIRKDK